MKKSTLYILLVGFVLIAVATSLYLLFHYQRITIEHPQTKSFCSVSQTFDCDDVAASDEAKVMGIPAALLGLFAYLFLGCLLVFDAIKKGEFRRQVVAIIALTALPMLLFSFFKAYQSFFILKKVCLFCTLLYGCIMVILTTAKLLFQGKTSEMVKIALVGEKGRNAIFIVALTLVLAGVVSAVINTMVIGVYTPKSRAQVTDIATPEVTPPAQETPANNPVQLKAHRIIEAYDRASKVGFDLASTPVKGASNAVIEIVEFSDFECPACANMFSYLKKLLSRFEGKYKFYYKHYPLDQSCNKQITRSMHKLACKAAYRAYCAGRQGKFWGIHDRIFENQRSLSESFLTGLATLPGMDATAFNACLEKEAAPAIERDIEEGNRVGVASTPTLFINGRNISTHIQRLDDLDVLLDYLVKGF